MCRLRIGTEILLKISVPSILPGVIVSRLGGIWRFSAHCPHHHPSPNGDTLFTEEGFHLPTQGRIYTQTETPARALEKGKSMYTPAALLDGAIKKLTDEKGEIIVSTFFDGTEALAIEGNRLIIKVDTDLTRSILQQRFAAEVADIISELAGGDTRLTPEFISDPARIARYEKSKSELSGYSFDTFIVGSSNKLAHAACVAVANGLCSQGGLSAIYNPLFIYGPSGLGKTHLLKAIISMVENNRFDKKVVYIRGEEFTSQLIEAIQNGSQSEFREKYRYADLLLVDDIQFIAGKDSTQEEFFHTFNALYESNKQIVLASDRPPKEMATLEERLRTRFEWGLITDIQPPDLETRMAIVNAKARTFGLELTYEVSEFIAASITSNVRQLEGVVKKIAALQAILPQSSIDRSIAERAIRDIRQENPGLSPTPDLILTEVSSFTGITKDKILGRSKSKEIARARQILVYLITEMTELSLPDIGRFIGRDHTTALYARDKIRGEIQVDPELAATIKDLKKNIRNR